jgi:hypothetical protein
MQSRTFFRTMLDILFNNSFFKAVNSYVKFCNEQRYYNDRELKFFENVPINNLEHNPFTQNKFVFKVNK